MDINQTINRMKNIGFYFSILLVASLLTLACKEEEGHSPVTQGGDIPPVILNPVAEPLPGAVKISYEIPVDQNFFYVKAQSVLESGEVREIKASYYANSLIIDGFSEERNYLIKLYSVGRNGRMSNPVEITCTPLESPIYTAFRSVKESLTETFGGIKFKVTNPSKANLRVYFYQQSKAGEWDILSSFFTSSEETNYSIRGMEPVAKKIRMEVRDRWGNATSYYEDEFVPYFEEKLDKTKFRQYDLPTDQNTPNGTKRTMDKIWDEVYLFSNNDFTTTPGYGIPQWFTFDLGQTARLSRLVIWNRTTGASYIYNGGAVKVFELYGSPAPNPDGSWDESWVSLRNEACRSVKPSGLPLGEYNSDDIQRQTDGEEFEMDYNEPVRYVRFRTNEVWGGPTIGHINICEISLYGEIIK